MDNNYGNYNGENDNNNPQENNNHSGYGDPSDNGNFYNPGTQGSSQSDNYSQQNNQSSNNDYSSNYGEYNSQNNSADNGTNSANEANNQYSQYGGNVQYKWNYDDYEKALHNNKNKKNKDGKKHGLKAFIITVSSVFAVAVIGLAIFGVISAVNNSKNNSNATSNGASISIEKQPTTSSTTTTSGEVMTNEQVAEKLTPAVVGIEMYNLSSVEPIAEGSGIVISEDGYIVTNAHVIEDGEKACVVMSDGTKYDTVKVVGSDTKSDLAVLKINATGLTKATFGDSSQLKLGQSVIAIGNPGGLTFQNSVTNGIVSGLNRTVSTSSSGNEMTYIQTNALINPGNSGGPLVNMYGQVVGINTAKISEDGYEGIGFAIPISTAKPYIDSIMANGYVTGRVKVGVSVYSLSESQAKWYNYPSGLYVESIERDCDAYAQGLRTKDIITEINGKALANSDSSTVFSTFSTEEKKHKAGETVTVKVYRTETGKTLTISFKLEEDKGDTDTSTQESQSGNSNGNSDDNSSGYSNGYSNGNSNGNSDSNANDFFSQFMQ